MKETYLNMENVLKSINYSSHKWSICSDLKVVSILLGLQQGYTKFCCFLCMWDSRAWNLHYQKKDWPLRGSPQPGTKNVVHMSLVESNKIVLPPLHIKLGLMKNFVKAMDRDRSAFRYLSEKFHTLSEAKKRVFSSVPRFVSYSRIFSLTASLLETRKQHGRRSDRLQQSFLEMTELTTTRTFLKIFCQPIRPWDVTCC